MENELIRLMREGIDKQYYDEDWYGDFFEIFESSIPLTPDEQEMFIKFLSHGYSQEWKETATPT